MSSTPDCQWHKLKQSLACTAGCSDPSVGGRALTKLCVHRGSQCCRSSPCTKRIANALCTSASERRWILKQGLTLAGSHCHKKKSSPQLAKRALSY
ncbi:hypothetical protein BC826DRAFT_442052 [Russula brevipes]|nr:hypothetical protein BC826DRAFT_442052 [Russula brevipes]